MVNRAQAPRTLVVWVLMSCAGAVPALADIPAESEVCHHSMKQIARALVDFERDGHRPVKQLTPDVLKALNRSTYLTNLGPCPGMSYIVKDEGSKLGLGAYRLDPKGRLSCANHGRLEDMEAAQRAHLDQQTGTIPPTLVLVLMALGGVWLLVKRRG